MEYTAKVFAYIRAINSICPEPTVKACNITIANAITDILSPTITHEIVLFQALPIQFEIASMKIL